MWQINIILLFTYVFIHFLDDLTKSSRWNGRDIIHILCHYVDMNCINNSAFQTDSMVTRLCQGIDKSAFGM